MQDKEIQDIQQELDENEEIEAPKVEVLEIICECELPVKIPKFSSKRKPHVCACGRWYWWKSMLHTVVAVHTFENVGQQVLLTRKFGDEKRKRKAKR